MSSIYGSHIVGMGQVDVSSLAAAFLAHQINPSFGPAVTSPSAFAGANPTVWPGWMFPDSETAQQIANLLGVSLESLPVEYAGGVVNVPTALWLSDAEGNVRVGDVIQAGNLASGSLCQVAQNLANAIPGGQAPSSCGPSVEVTPGGPAIVPTLANPLPTGGNSALGPGGYIGPVATTPIPTSAPIPVSSPIVTNPVSVSLPGTPISAPVTTGSPTSVSGSNIIANPAPAGGGSSIGGPNWVSGTWPAILTSGTWPAILTEDSFGGIPNWVWLSGVVLAIFAFGGRR